MPGDPRENQVKRIVQGTRGILEQSGQESEYLPRDPTRLMHPRHLDQERTRMGGSSQLFYPFPPSRRNGPRCADPTVGVDRRIDDSAPERDPYHHLGLLRTRHHRGTHPDIVSPDVQGSRGNSPRTLVWTGSYIMAGRSYDCTGHARNRSEGKSSRQGQILEKRDQPGIAASPSVTSSEEERMGSPA